jgi:hypothetical protein
VAFGSSVGAGHLLVSGNGAFASDTANAPTDTLSDTFVATDTAIAAAASGGLFYAANSGSGADTVTGNWSASAGTIQETIAEFAGVATSSPLDGTKHGEASGNGTTGTVASITASLGDLVVALLVVDAGGTAQTITNGGTGAAFTLASAGTDNTRLFYAIDTTGGTYIPNAAWGGTANNWAIFIAAFKPFSPSGADAGVISEGPTTVRLNNADALTLAEAMANALAVAQSAVVVDTASIAVAAQQSATFSEAAAIAIVSNDTTTLTDLAAIALAASEAATVTDSALISIPVTGTDAVTLSDAATIAAQATGQDSLTLAELVGIVSATAATASVTLAEAAVNALGASDITLLTEGVSVVPSGGNTPSGSDAGTVAEQAAIVAAMAATDQAALFEAVTLALKTTQGATLAEQIALAIVLGDQAVLVDAVSVAVAIAAAQAITVAEAASVSIQSTAAIPGRHTVSDAVLFTHTVSDSVLFLHTVSDQLLVVHTVRDQ